MLVMSITIGILYLLYKAYNKLNPPEPIQYGRAGYPIYAPEEPDTPYSLCVITAIIIAMIVLLLPVIGVFTIEDTHIEKIELASMGSTGYSEGYIGGFLVTTGNIEGVEYLTYYTPIGDNIYKHDKILVESSVVEIIDNPDDVGIYVYTTTTYVNIIGTKFTFMAEKKYIVKVLQGQFSQNIMIQP